MRKDSPELGQKEEGTNLLTDGVDSTSLRGAGGRRGQTGQAEASLVSPEVVSEDGSPSGSWYKKERHII